MDNEKGSDATEKDASVQGVNDLKDAVRSEQSNSATTAQVMNSSRGQSTGPRTERAKRISSRNALKLGFFAWELKSLHISTEEDRQEFGRLLDGFIDHWEPIGQAELVQVELMAMALYQYKCLLRLARVRRADIGTDILDNLRGNSAEIDPKLELWRNELPPLDELEKF